MKFSAIIFDCDGVLTDSERLLDGVEARFVTESGLPLTPEQMGAIIKGKRVQDLVEIVSSRLNRKLSDEWTYDLAMACAYAYVRELKPIAGVAEVLAQLQRAGVPICAASQAPLWRVRLGLFVTGLEKYFDGKLYCAAMVARGKPAPDLFLHAARQLGAEPGACAVIEDTAIGATAGKNAGMTVFGYAADTEPAELEAAGARVFRRMAELPNLLGL